MINFLKTFADDESGSTAIEYALITALVAVPIIASSGVLGKQLALTFNAIRDHLAKPDV